MKPLLALLLLFLSLNAGERPKIALVLSGGGARGGAHVGVLKFLEEQRVPIDFIVGTSMGSVVGGLYASGKTPAEIEDMLISTKWEEFIRTDYERSKTPMRSKEAEYDYHGRLGFGIDIDSQIVVPTGLLKREPLLLKFANESGDAENIMDFDRLRIPFRAVATNIRDGEAVVLKSGSLAKAMYASSAIPGGLQPINIEGADLVDGGVSLNIPIEVAKEMGADVVIAVDVSENFAKELNVNSYFVVMGQLVDILMRKNANDSLALLGERDIRITPDLNGYGGLDTHKYKEIIQKGEEAAGKTVAKLFLLSLSKEEYARYLADRVVVKQSNEKFIDKIELLNHTTLNDQTILGHMLTKEGSLFSHANIQEDILRLYNLKRFDSVDYEMLQREGKNLLRIKLTPNYSYKGEINFAFGIEDDFRGHNSYAFKMGYTMKSINEYGAEWKSDIAIGREQLFHTEFYQPLGYMQQLYVKPAYDYMQRVDVVSRENIGISMEGNEELEITRYGSSLTLGAYIGNSYALEAALAHYRDMIKLNSFVDIGGGFYYPLNLDEHLQAVPFSLSFLTDSLDNLNFPSRGMKAKLLWTKESPSLGSDYDYEQIYFDIEKPLNFAMHNITAYLKAGKTYNINGETALAGSFSLGGLFNLSGYTPYAFNDDNMLLGVLKYRYELKNGGFFGSLNVPLYTGFSLEAGGTWENKEKPNYDIIRKSATIYAAADTFLGPFYVAYGYCDANEQAVYLYLGEKF